MIVKHFQNHKHIYLILIVTLFSIVAGNIMLIYDGLDLRSINERIEIGELMKFQLIQILVLSLAEIKFGEFPLKDIRRGLMIVLVVYLIPFFIKWQIYKEILLKCVEEEVMKFWRVDIECLESKDLILSLRYVMVLLICTLVFMYIKNSMRTDGEISSKIIRWGVCVGLCISVSYIYMGREKNVKNESQLVMKDAGVFVKKFNYIKYAADIEWGQDTLNSTEEALDRTMWHKFGGVPGEIIDLKREILTGDSWEPLYEEWEKHNFLEGEMYGYEPEEADSRLQELMKMKDEQRLELVKKEANEMYNEYIKFLQNEGIYQYLGVWSKSDLEYKLKELFDNQCSHLRYEYILYYW